MVIILIFLLNNSHTARISLQLNGGSISGDGINKAALTCTQTQGGTYRANFPTYFSISSGSWNGFVNETIPINGPSGTVIPDTPGLYQLQAWVMNEESKLYSNTLNIYVLSITPNSVSFAAVPYHAIQQDMVQQPYSAPQWIAQPSPAPPISYPVCYEKNTQMDVTPDFTITPAPSDSIPLQINAIGTTYYDPGYGKTYTSVSDMQSQDVGVEAHFYGITIQGNTYYAFFFKNGSFDGMTFTPSAIPTSN
jgi:hypothetical protein